MPQLKKITGTIIDEGDNFKELVEKNKSDLSRADLSGANLSGADLSGANLSGVDLFRAKLSGADLSRAKIEFPKFPSIRTLSSMPLKSISDEIILELMRWDAQAHPNPQLFDVWAKGGDCPYQNEERWWMMPEKREVWKLGNPTMRLSDLILEICRQEGWKIKGYLE